MLQSKYFLVKGDTKAHFDNFVAWKYQYFASWRQLGGLLPYGATPEALILLQAPWINTQPIFLFYHFFGF